MAKVKQGEKEQILQYLKRAEEATIEEQDRYRAIIARTEDSEASEGLNQNILGGHLESISKIMQDCHYPPEYDERKRFLKISCEQEPNRIKLEKIRDEDIRYRTQLLNGMIEHTQRIRAMAMFAERVGSLKGLMAIVFKLWSESSSLQIIYSEAVQMGKDTEAQLILQECTAKAKVADLLLQKCLENSTAS